MHVQAGGDGLVDGPQEFQVFGGSVTVVQLADDGAAGDVEPGVTEVLPLMLPFEM
jgi:hypothetical protein